MNVKKAAAVAGFFSAALIGAIALGNGTAKATEDNGTVNPIFDCTNANEIKKWYGHDDEATLFANVTSTEKGLHFNGPSLAHRDITDTKLEDLAKHAELTTVDVTGVAPLVKFRTDAPFSTLNIDAAGKWWSSKIDPASPGGISNPVTGPADLVGLTLNKNGGTAKYDENTVAADIQIGYANDAGNSATVTKLVHQGVTYSFTCPEPDEEPTANPTSPAATKPPTTRPTKPAARPTQSELPLTGEGGGKNWPVTIAVSGGGIVTVGALLIWAASRRRKYVA